MPAVAHLYDLLDASHGGTVTGASGPLVVDGRPVACVGDPVHCTLHGPQTIVTGSPRLQFQGRPVAVHGSVCSCGATLLSASCLDVAL
jgi:uncharacterized Zn-binding protein involved in type VI secretion